MAGTYDFDEVWEAIVNGDVEHIRRLLEQGSINSKNINSKSEELESFGMTALMKSVCEGQEAIVQMLIDSGADVNIRDNKQGWTALMYSGTHSREKIARILLDSGAHLEGRDFLGETAILKSVEYEQEKMVQFFAALGADLNIQNHQGLTALMVSALSGQEKVVKILVDAGADLNLQDYSYGETALIKSVSQLDESTLQRQEKIVQILVDSGAVLNIQNNQGLTALMASVLSGQEKVVQIIVDAGADLNLQDGLYGETALIKSVSRRDESTLQSQEEIVQILVDSGADLNIKNNQGLTALMASVLIGKSEIVQILADSGADLDIHDYYGDTALIKSTLKGGSSLKILIDSGANLNLQGHGGYTALMNAATFQQETYVQMLIVSGADLNLQDSAGNTALIHSVLNGFTEIPRILVQSGANLNIQSDSGETALIKSARLGKPEIVQLLVDSGADLNLQDRNGRTALIQSALNRHGKIARMLADSGADLNIPEKDGATALSIFASTYGGVAEVEYLLDAGADYKMVAEHISEDKKKYKRMFGEKVKKLEKARAKFSDVIMSGDKTSCWNRSRLMFVGQGRAGKSSTVRSLLGQPFNPWWDSTIGAEVSNYMASETGWEDNGKIGDHTTLFAARIMSESTTERRSVFPFTKNIKKKSHVDSKRNANNSLEYKKNLKPTTAGLNTVNLKYRKKLDTSLDETNNKDKTSTSDAQVSQNNSKIKEHKNTEILGVTNIRDGVIHKFKPNLLVDSENKKEAISLSLWDFGGQSVFYSMHHIFLTKSGVYILVFDTREFLKERTEEPREYILFWLRSIRMHAPTAPVLMAGTFSNELETKSDLMEIEITLKAFIGDDFPQIISNEASLGHTGDTLSYFPIDNKTSFGIGLLRQMIEQMTRKDPFVSLQVSIKWMVLLDHILSKRDQLPYLTLSHVRAAAKDIGINEAVELESALELFHQQGMIIHLKATDVLKNIIVVNPQWLIENVSKVIRDRDVHTFDDQVIEKTGMKDEIIRTFESGLASEEFFHFVWENVQEHNFFLDLMKRTMLLSEWSFAKEKLYIVPSLLHRATEEQVSNQLVDSFRFVLDFADSFLPTGTFQRLICLATARCGLNRQHVEDPILFADFASIEIEPGCNIKLWEDKRLQRINVYTESNLKAKSYAGMIRSMLAKINYDVMSKGLKWEILFENPSNKSLVREDEAKKKKLYPWFDDENHKAMANKPINDASLELFLETL